MLPVRLAGERGRLITPLSRKFFHGTGSVGWTSDEQQSVSVCDRTAADGLEKRDATQGRL